MEKKEGKRRNNHSEQQNCSVSHSVTHAMFSVVRLATNSLMSWAVNGLMYLDPIGELYRGPSSKPFMWMARSNFSMVLRSMLMTD